MTPGLLDHVIAFVLVVVAPISAMRGMRRFLARVRLDPGARRAQYKGTIASQWSVVAIVLAIWFSLGRDCAAIGLTLPLGIQTVVGFTITAMLLFVFHRQRVAVREGGEPALEALRDQLGEVRDLLPRTDSEARWFRALSVTAGICEEILYRGFMLAYLGALLGTLPAVLASAVIFGVAHIYQGRVNALKVAVVSLLAGCLYVGCGTLLWPIILHAAMDLNAGALGRMAVTDRSREPT